MSDVRCLVRPRHVSSRTCGESSGGTTEAVHILGNTRNQALEIHNDFHDPQNEETRGIKAGMHWDFRNAHAAPNHAPSPSSPCVFVTSRVMLSIQPRGVMTSVSHISCPYRAGTSFTPGLIPSPPSSSAEMPYSTWGHVFVIEPLPISTSL